MQLTERCGFLGWKTQSVWVLTLCRCSKLSSANIQKLNGLFELTAAVFAFANTRDVIGIVGAKSVLMPLEILSPMAVFKECLEGSWLLFYGDK